MIPSGKSQLKDHKAIFPEKLVYKILANFTKEKDIIYDPFMGCGSTAVVCKKMNRFFIGSEVNKEYVDIAIQRLHTDKLEKLDPNHKKYIQPNLLF